MASSSWDRIDPEALIALIRKHPGLTAVQLATRLRQKPQTMRAHLMKLCKAGVLEVRREPGELVTHMGYRVR